MLVRPLFFTFLLFKIDSHKISTFLCQSVFITSWKTLNWCKYSPKISLKKWCKGGVNHEIKTPETIGALRPQKNMRTLYIKISRIATPIAKKARKFNEFKALRGIFQNTSRLQ